MTINDLKTQLRASRDSLPETLAVRLHRALSWLKCAEEQPDNIDLQYISLWISFNACYGVDEEGARSLGERELFQRFLQKLVKHDKEKAIYNCLWTQFSGPVKALIKNKFVFAPFWEAQQQGGDNSIWEPRFVKSSAAAHNFLTRQMVPELLGVVLDRLYVLRNQLMHGGATYQSQVNREQVRDGCNMLKVLMPLVIGIMLEAGEEDWGDIYYPVVKS